MGLRFRRSFRIVPGWRINFSKSGVSTSFGRRGAWFTVGPRGTRETLGIPGTGVSYTTEQRAHREAPKSDEQRIEEEVNLFRGILFVVGILGLIVLFGHLAAH
jgi:hypothetical protein